MTEAALLLTAAILAAGAIAWVVLAIVPGWEPSNVVRTIVNGGLVVWLLVLFVVAANVALFFAGLTRMGVP